MGSLTWGILVLLLGYASNVAKAYPMMMEISDEVERCININIPGDDDAHLVFVALPSPAAESDEENDTWQAEQKKLEAHFMGEMVELSRQRSHSSLPKKFPNEPPEEISQLMTKFLGQFEGEQKAGCKAVISNPETDAVRTLESFWFTPVVINHIRKALRSNDQKSVPLEGYEICFDSEDEEVPIQIGLEVVLTTDPLLDSEEDDAVANNLFEGSSLTPLAEQLGESIDAASSVLREMQHMERREQRMRQTADSINTRVRYFSYISIAVLLVVAYVQVSYLKRYFRKKKLM